MSKLIEKAHTAGDFIPGDDGDYVWWPRGLGGYLNAASLRELADELDRINAAAALVSTIPLPLSSREECCSGEVKNESRINL